MKYQREYQSEVLEKDYPEINLRPKPNYFLIFIIFAVVMVAVWCATTSPNKDPQLAPERQTKRDSAISRVKKRTHKKEQCEQYALIAIYSDYYPVLQRGVKIANDSIWLNTGEVWKYGKTCVGELKRYPGQVYYYDGKYLLDFNDLYYSELGFRISKNQIHICLVQVFFTCTQPTTNKCVQMQLGEKHLTEAKNPKTLFTLVYNI